jgi:hypothetical protein
VLRLARYGGLAGAVLVALAGYLGGALPGLGSPAAHRPPALAAWFGGLALLVAAWWRLRDADLPRRWVYTTAALWLLPIALAPPVGSRDAYAYACQGWVYAAGGDPYRDGVAACPWVDSVSLIWRDTPAPYGPLFLVLAALAVKLGHGLAGTLAVLRVFAVGGVALAAGCLPVLARRCGVPEGRALWLALACPIVGIHLVGGVHNDALMVGLMVAGLAVAAARLPRTGVPVGAGALVGLAIAVKATAVVVLPFAALAAVPRLRVAAAPRLKAGAALGAGAALVGGAGAAVLAGTYASGLGFGWVGGLTHTGESVQWTAPATAVGLTIGYAARLTGADVNAVPVTRAVAVAALAVVLAVLWWRALRDGDAMRRAGLALGATVALAPVFHPWYLTWPLAVLAATTTRTRWLAVICAAASFLVLSNGTALALYTKLAGALAMTALLAFLAVRALQRPVHDVDVDQS